MPALINKLFSLDNKVALITGASSGIGYHLAGVYANAGAKVIALARRQDKLTELTERINDENGTATYVAADLLNCNDFSALGNQLAEHYGTIDILLNAAGINLRQRVEDVRMNDWNKTLALNLSVPFFLAQALVPAMKSNGSGKIINIASLQSFRAFENGIAYGASKGGITQLTRAMAQAWSRYGINANAIAPGFFPTELTAKVFEDDELQAHHARATAIGRNGEMADLDGTAIFLASTACDYVTGQIIAVDGGYLAK